MLRKIFSPRHLAGRAVLLLLTLLLLTACTRTKATDITLAYYTLITQQDIQPLITLGMSKATAEQTLVSLKRDLHEQIKNELNMNERLNLDDATIDQVAQAYLASLHRLSATATQRKDDNQYIVTLSSTYIDYYTIDEMATAASLSAIDINKYKDHKIYLNDLTHTYIKELVHNYENALPSHGTLSKEFIFTKQNGLYLPEDYNVFIQSLCEFICMQHT